MVTDALQNLMSAKVYAEYDRIRKEDGGLNPNIVDSQKGREELTNLLSGVRISSKSSKADIVLLKALVKASNLPYKRYDVRGEETEGNTLFHLMSSAGYANYKACCSHLNNGDKNPDIIDSPGEYKSLKKLLHTARQEKNYFSEADIIMLKALLDVASDYAPKVANKPSWLDRFKPKQKQNDEEKPVVPTPCEPKSEKPEQKETCPKVQPKTQKTEPKQVKPKERQPQKVQNDQPTQPNNNQNNTGINNSFNNNSGVIIIK